MTDRAIDVAESGIASGKQRHLVGIGRQVLILAWKNGILFKRNVSGTVCELVVALLFLLFLLVIRFFVDSDKSLTDNPTTSVIGQVGQFVKNGTNLVLFYPNNAYIQSIVTQAVGLMSATRPSFNATVVASSTSDALQLDSTIIANLYAFVSFPDNYVSLASLPNAVSYTIFSSEKTSFQYNIGTNFYTLAEFLYTASPEYYCAVNSKFFLLYTQLFNPIKHAVDLALITSITGVNMLDPSMVTTSQFDCLSYDNDLLKARFSFFPPILISIAFLFTLIVNLGNIIVEKQTKMKEYLKLVGIKWYAIWITWFIRSLGPYLVLSLLVSLIGVIQFNPRQYGVTKAVFLHTDFVLVFSIFFVYSVQTAMFTLLLGQIFSQTFVAKVVAIIIWLMTAINLFGSASNSTRYFFCLFPNSALQFIFQVVNQFERSSKHLGYSNMYTNLYDDSLTVGGVLSLMIVWTLVYVPISWYIERIFPGEYGAPLPFYFPFMKSYWFGESATDRTDDIEFNKIKEANEKTFGFETEPSSLRVAISIQNISKKFKTGFKEKTVVNNMSMNFYENQITGLLGHNGAGKTTTTFMLCGIYAPNAGNAFIMGKSIRTEMNEIRASVGFCPQHDILFDELTVSEHLDMIASIKGYSKEEIKQEILSISTFVGLQDDLEKKSKQLSGGMKRRLSVAMALTGGSKVKQASWSLLSCLIKLIGELAATKVIILDEPTSGLDPFNRRTLWELIRRFKQGRSILLTTHFMEEADALSDRIAIMNHGQVKCCGSPIFLKNTFGSGFRLTVAKNGLFDEKRFALLLGEQLATFNVESNIAAEMSVSIPFVLSAKLPDLLTNIETNKNTYGIDGYGISSPTIEEVFIKIGSIDKQDPAKTTPLATDAEQQAMPILDDLSNAFANEFTKNAGLSLWLQQMSGLFMKRWRIFFRRYILAAIILALPLLLEGSLCSLIPSQTNLINSLRGIVQSTGTYSLGLANYGAQLVPYSLQGSASVTQTQALLGSMFGAASPTRSGVQLVNVSSTSASAVDEYVLGLRKASLANMYASYYAGFSLNQTAANKLYAALDYSTLAFHSSANVLHDVDNVLLAVANNYQTSRSISTVNAPLAANSSLTNTTNFLLVLACVDSFPVSLLNFINALVVSFMVSIMVIHVARERCNGAKQLQMLSGTHYLTYWLANYAFDLCVFAVNIVSIIGVLKLVDAAKNDPTNEINAVAGNENLGYLLLFMLIASFAWCTFAYVWSFYFRSDIVGFVVLVIVLGVLAFVESIFTFFQLLVYSGSSSAGSNLLYAIKMLLALVFPNVTLKRVMYNMKIRTNSYCVSSANNVLGTSYSVNESPLSLKEPGYGLMLLFSVIQFLVGFLILVLKEKQVFANGFISGCFQQKSSVDATPTLQLEDDVQNEANRIQKTDPKELAKSEPLVVSSLVKQFKKKKVKFVAVNHLSFGIKRNECFGLLGLNGAGKTTTFKMLTGEIDQTSGNAFINGYDVKADRLRARGNLGFCPQFDILPEFLTVHETFKLIAALRGLSSESLEKVIGELTDVFKLNEFSGKLVQNLSGGNKRKVSSAIAFIGRPSVVILDEPTTGMDPAARRYLWAVIKKAIDFGMTIVLTTHSMEESEALSTRLGIMVNGQFKCLGSIQHLKNKYGKGYSLIIKTRVSSDTSEDVTKVEEFVRCNIKHSKMKDKQQETLFYQIENDQVKEGEQIQTIAELFTLIETNKEQLKLETYSLSQTTLEQIFLAFAREQKNNDL